MKYQIVFLLLTLSAFGLQGQNNLEATYIEIIPQFKGWQFRTSPTSEFQPIGLIGQNLAPYLGENLAAQDAFREYQRGRKVYFVGLGGTVVGVGTFIYGINNINESALIASVIINGISSIAMFSGAVKSQNKLYETIDYHNFNKSPVSMNLRPKVRPSSHSIGIGLVWEIK